MSNPHVLIETTEGDILVELFADKAPVSVENFLKYVDSGHYEETIFHRVIRDFMIQGGGMTMNMDEKPTGAPIKNEAGNGLKNLTGTLAMARTMVVDSATAQFFINVKDNAFLDHQDESVQGFGYAVFGQVVEGMDVVMKISKRKTKHFKGHDDVPADPVFINKVQRFEV